MKVSTFTPGVDAKREEDYEEVLSSRSQSSIEGNEHSKKKRRGIPIWLLLVGTSLLVVVTVSVSITLISYFSGQYTINNLSKEVRTGYMAYIYNYVLQSMSTPIIAQAAMQGFFNNDVIALKGSLGTNLTDHSDYLRFLLALSSQFPAVTFIGFATPNWIMTLYKIGGINAPPIVAIAQDPLVNNSNFYSINYTTNTVISPPFVSFPYSLLDDPSWTTMDAARVRLWSALQVAPNGDLSCGLQVPMFTTNGSFIGYTLASYSLDVLMGFFVTLQPTKNAVAFIVDGNGYLIATNQNGSVSYINNSTGIRVQYLGTEAGDALGNKIIPEATQYFLDVYKGKNVSQFEGEFSGKKGRVLVDIYAFKDIAGFNLTDYPLDWYLLLAIPRNDFVGHIEANFRTSIILTIVFVILGALMSVVTSLFITQPLTTLKNSMNSVATLDVMDSQGANGATTSRRSPRYLVPLREIQSMKNSFDKMRNGIVSFGKFVPVEYVKYLLQSNKEAHRSLTYSNVTCLFMDIVGFTSLSEKMVPKDLQNVLGKFFDEMSTIILQNEGTIDKYIGDCVMAVWNAPQQIDNHCGKACWAAIKCLEQLDKTRAKFEQLGAPNFRVRIGIHTGGVLVGNVGSKQRLNFTVLGDTVNVASRLEALNKRLQLDGIIVSSNVRDAVAHDKNLIMEDQGEHLIDGRSAPIHVYLLKPQQSMQLSKQRTTVGAVNATPVYSL